MPRKNFRKGEINYYTGETLKAVLNAIRNDGRNMRDVGRFNGIPESILRKQLLSNESKTLRLSRETIFLREVEGELKSYICIESGQVILWHNI